MASQKAPSALRTNFTLSRDTSSDLSLSVSSDSAEQMTASPEANTLFSGFKWSAAPASADPASANQTAFDDANREAAQRLDRADSAINTPPSSLHPALSKPRLSSQLSATLDNMEEQRRQELDPKSLASPSSAVNRTFSTLQRSFSSSTGKSMVSDNGASPALPNPFPSMLPRILQNTVLLPLSLLHALVPQQLLDTNTSCQEGLSASTMQVPMTSVNALMEACSAIEWIAKATLALETTDANNTRSIQQGPTDTQSSQPDEGPNMSHFDIFEMVQKVADVVSGVAASRGIDLVLDLLPSLLGEPAENQQHYRLGTCTVWADRSAINFLLMSCLSKVVHAVPARSTVIISCTLTEKDETFLSDASVPDTKLMVFTLGLQFIVASEPSEATGIHAGLSDPYFLATLDAFGAQVVADKTDSQSTSVHRTHLHYSISVPVGKLPSANPSADGSSQAISDRYGPSSDQLSTFISTLKGKQVALYAESSSTFAQNLDQALTSYGCNVAPVYLDSPSASPSSSERDLKRSTNTAVALTSGRPTLVSYDSELRAQTLSAAVASHISADCSKAVEIDDIAVLDPVTGVPVTFHNGPSAKTPAGTQSKAGRTAKTGQAARSPAEPFTFVIIDDDIATLQKELLRIRSAVPLLKSALASHAAATKDRPSRPPLAHRTKSSPQIERVQAEHLDTLQTRSNEDLSSTNTDAHGAVHSSVTQTIIFFTSMKSYRVVRDTVQPIIDSASFRGDASPPEIMVLPKPAGIRRILTALYTTEHKSVVQLPFQPIATSPLSPLTTHGRSWWTPQASGMQSDDGFMTLTRNETLSPETEADTTPSTPWSPMESVALTPGTSLLPSQNKAATAASHRSTDVRSHSRAKSVSANTRTERASDASTVGETPPDQPANLVDADEATFTSRSSHSTSAGGAGAAVSAEALEYFSETAAKIGGSAASGMVIQSPDGRPAGIFFQPMASMSSTSLAGSKPSLSRNVSMNSVRRGSATALLERPDGSNTPSITSNLADNATRDRRMANRSTSSSQSKRNLSDLSTARNIPTTNGERDDTTAKSPTFQTGNYPSGSMFTPQVGIHSVLSGSRPPMTTPLLSHTSQPATTPMPPPKAEAPPDAVSTQEDAPSKAGEAATKPVVTSASKTIAKSVSASSGSSAGNRRSTGKGKASVPPPIKMDKVAAKAPVVTPALKSAALPGFPTSNAPDTKSKPSAVPQSGFMIGMGFTSSAQRGRGPRKAPVREAVLPPIKVLIVEDNPINQRILSMFMTKKKIQFDVANNGLEAVNKWKTGGYHLILMDIQLPVMDGISATKEIRKLERNANIGILPNTPPAGTDVQGGDCIEQSTKGASAAANTLSAQGLMKYPVGGALTCMSASNATPAAAVGSPSSTRGALINGVGKDNARLIKKASGSGINPFRASVIIVALTASVLSSDRVEALAAGCNDFLNKPVSLPWLNQKILEWGSMMYLMYSGLSTDDLSQSTSTAAISAGGKDTNKAQLHLGFGYGPAEKAKALANNLHLGDTLAQKKQRKQQQQQQQQQETQDKPLQAQASAKPSPPATLPKEDPSKTTP